MSLMMQAMMAASRRRVSFDPDAADYFARIVAAGSTISNANKGAVDAFVKGCKADGIWSAINASCILAGADTLAGALVPLVGPAPTNFNFVAGDYSRTTGLIGDGSTKYLDCNFNENTLPQNDFSMSAWLTSQIVGFVLGSSTTTATNGSGMAPGAAANTFRFRSRYPGGSETDFGNSTILGFIGHTRSNSASFTSRTGSVNTSITSASGTPINGTTMAFRRPNTSSPIYSSSRNAFYHIGTSLDLALLDARVSTLMSSIS